MGKSSFARRNNINPHNYSVKKFSERPDSFHKRNNASNDGKFSFLEFGKNIIKGTGQFFVDIAKNIIKNPVSSLIFMGLGAAMASTALGLTVLSGAGIFSVLFGAAILGIQSANLINHGKWDDLEKKGKDLGKLIPAAIISTMSAVKGSKMLAETAAKMQNTTKSETSLPGLLSGMRKAISIDSNIGWSLIKNAVKAPFKAVKSLVKNPIEFFKKNNLKNLHKFFTEGVQKDYGNVMKGLDKKLFSENEINYLNTLFDKGNPGMSGIFDLKFSGLRNTMKAKEITPIVLKQAGNN